MKITHLKVNHLVNPLGYDIPRPAISYVVEETIGKRQKKVQVLVSLQEDFSSVLFDSGEMENLVNTGVALPIRMEPETRYYWKVRVWADNGDWGESGTAWFETPKGGEWEADWITPKAPKETQVFLSKRISITKPVKKARMYMVGLGVYELYINGEKQGEECLLPGFCDYDAWIPYQTFEIGLSPGGAETSEGEKTSGKGMASRDIEIKILLGDGWYKGWFGLCKTRENYGDALACIGELHIWYEDGTRERVCTDTTWKAGRSKIVSSGIYPGEVYDATLKEQECFDVKKADLDKGKLTPRINPPIRVHERIKPVEVLHTPAGETVLDMGQIMTGWLEFCCRAKAGKKIFFQFGEILQEGNFYNANLRTARAEFTYISDGIERLVGQHFTFYGFRYVKITGWEGEVNAEDFRGLVIHSEMEETGYIETSDPLVNRLFQNIRWGQKGNFLDVPTDCPQRDERCGWTGDAQVFSGTACYNMDVYAFYTKYGRDIYDGQRKLGGSVPDVAPMANFPGHGSTAWGDAATIIPWNVYLHYGNKEILAGQYESCKAWVDYMKSQDDRYGGKRLWQSGFHYGDWLALDGNIRGGVYGATDPYLISSAYYYYSTTIVAKAAKVLGKEEDAAFYGCLAGEIKEAFIREYFTPTGRLSVDTMTAYVLTLYLGLVPEENRERACEGLLGRLKKNRYHLGTGFVGTPYLCRVLTENGMNDLAYHLLLEKGYPGWLYEVEMGATTVWERWDSVLPDGKISGTEMNSLNHYAYGSIAEWMYRNMAGIQPLEESPGFKRFRIAPSPSYRLSWVRAVLRSAGGRIESGWRIENGELHLKFVIPFDTQAVLVLPDARLSEIKECLESQEGILGKTQAGRHVELQVEAGTYTFSYQPSIPYRKTYSLDSPMEELLENERVRKLLEEYSVYYEDMPFKEQLYTLGELLNGPFSRISLEEQKILDKKLREID